MIHHTISTRELTLKTAYELAQIPGNKIELGPDATKAIQRCRTFLDDLMQNAEAPVYGINTGFGSLCDTTISRVDLEKLQENLVMSHACGSGPEVPAHIVRLMLLLKVQSLSYGHSGVEVHTVQRLCDFFNRNMLPVVFEMGSLGASGDLAPLAHLCLPLLGRGQLVYNAQRVDARQALEREGLQPVKLRSKEGLALLNGTQFMSAYATAIVTEAQRLLQWADAICALSAVAYRAQPDPYAENIQRVRNHPGQQQCAQRLRAWLGPDYAKAVSKASVQDPYSFRCVPQVHGAIADVLTFAEAVVTREINAVTDNPTIFPETGEVISAGNFHGEPLALVLDQLAIALTELASISERRTFKLIGGTRQLPAFLVANPGLNSGFMIPQYAAAGMVSQCKQLATPASVDTIDSSNGQEDHVSMGANAATKCYRVLTNARRVLGIELLNAAQAVDLRENAALSPQLGRLHNLFRQVVPFLHEDAEMYPLIENAEFFIGTREAPEPTA